MLKKTAEKHDLLTWSIDYQVEVAVVNQNFNSSFDQFVNCVKKYHK